MNHNFHKLFLFVILIATSHAFARKMASKEDGEVDEKSSNIINNKESSLVKIGNIDSFDKLMGVESCEDEDEECLKRRVAVEAHLDYIYTQQHNKP